MEKRIGFENKSLSPLHQSPGTPKCPKVDVSFDSNRCDRCSSSFPPYIEVWFLAWRTQPNFLQFQRMNWLTNHSVCSLHWASSDGRKNVKITFDFDLPGTLILLFLRNYMLYFLYARLRPKLSSCTARFEQDNFFIFASVSW